MSHSLTVCIVQAPKRIQENGKSGLQLRGVIRFFDRKTKSELETEYIAEIFGKSPKESLMLEGQLSPGAIVKIFGNSQRIVKEENKFLIEILDPRIEVFEGLKAEKENDSIVTTDELDIGSKCEIEVVLAPKKSNIPPGYFVPDTRDFYGEN